MTRPRHLLYCWMLSLAACEPLSNEVDNPSSIPENDLSEPGGYTPESCEVLGWWTMDEGEGAVVSDQSIHGHDLELVAPQGGALPSWGQGRDGKGGLVFDIDPSQSDQVSQGAISWDEGLQDLDAASILGWVKGGDKPLYAQSIAGFGSEISWFNPVALSLSQESSLQLGLSDGLSGFTFDSEHQVPTGWVHVAAVASGAAGEWQLFVDGELVGEGQHVYDRFPDLDGPFALGVDYNEGGCHDGGKWCFPFVGELDEFKLLSCAIGAEEVARDAAIGWPWSDGE